MTRSDIDENGSLDAAEIMIGREGETEAVERRRRESKERKEKEAAEKGKTESSSREGGEEGGDKKGGDPFFITVEERLTLAVIHRTVGVMDRNGDGKSFNHTYRDS